MNTKSNVVQQASRADLHAVNMRYVLSTIALYCVPERQREHAHETLTQLSRVATLHGGTKHEGMTKQVICERAGV